jgi:hypothetical protein
MRRRLLLVAVALLLLGGAGMSLWLTTPKHRITKANIDHIEKGMTQEEVETVLGTPPGNYCRRGTLFLSLEKVPNAGVRIME